MKSLGKKKSNGKATYSKKYRRGKDWVEKDLYIGESIEKNQ